jgi:RHS repeat-associated protein
VVVEKYLWAGLTQLLAVYDGADNLVARFEYADGPLPVRMVQGGGVYYLAYDPVDSLRAVLDANGAIVHRIDYDSFGNILFESPSGPVPPMGFAGGLHDRDTGLVRFGFRDYDPDTGRWTGKDPMRFAGADTCLYTYCFNDPINGSDRVGLGTYEDILYHSGNFFAGMGDVLSFNVTAIVRERMDIDDVVNRSSGGYILGEVAGVTHGIVTGGALGSIRGARTGLARGMRRPNPAFPRGTEYVERSHWIPNRYKRVPEWIRNSEANIKLMWGSDHALADPMRYRFLKEAWKNAHTMPLRIVQQWNRAPYWAQGAAIGATVSEGSVAKTRL